MATVDSVLVKLIASLVAPVVNALVDPVDLFLAGLHNFSLGLPQFFASRLNRAHLLVDFARFRCGSALSIRASTLMKLRSLI